MSEEELREAWKLANRVLEGYFLEDTDEIGRAAKEAETLAEALSSLSDTVERMRAFMEGIPAPECFNARSTLEVYEAWEESGIMDVVMEKKEKDNE